MSAVSVEGALIALASLPYMAWDRLARIVEGRTPPEALEAVRRGEHGPVLARMAARLRPDALAAAHAAAGVHVRWVRGAEYPTQLAEDHEAPVVLFSTGDLDCLVRPKVAVIGTRRCTNYGRDVARELGRQLSEAGVVVLSGLAAGIDGAAHEGALAGGGAPPVGVVGSGLDVVYPRRHSRLWERVGQAGALLSEAPLGGRPEPWRFPARNRILAALADVVVVVESHETGGSMHTVRSAEERGVPVLAVPGPIRSRASAGTNELLSQGCHPLCTVDDVLTALSLQTAAELPAIGALRLVDDRAEPTGEAATVLDAVDFTATSPDAIAARTGLSPLRLSAALSWLERERWVEQSAGWWQRC